MTGECAFGFDRKRRLLETFHIEDQIYIDVDSNEHIEIDLHGRIRKIFFINFSSDFCVRRIDDVTKIKKKLALSICGYKATEVDQSLIDFLNMIIKNVTFYDIFIPPDMRAFVSEFDAWEEKIYES